MGRVMRSEGLVPDLVLVSTAHRTTETLEALQPCAEQPIVDASKALYLASAPRILDLLHNVNETVQSVLLIGHNPGLHELAVLLVGAHSKAAERKLVRRLAKSYPTGTLAEFALACPWSQIKEGSGRLVRFVTPRELKALA
jgi:phosphohistidine phosphatase